MSFFLSYVTKNNLERYILSLGYIYNLSEKEEFIEGEGSSINEAINDFSRKIDNRTIVFCKPGKDKVTIINKEINLILPEKNEAIKEACLIMTKIAEESSEEDIIDCVSLFVKENNKKDISFNVDSINSLHANLHEALRLMLIGSMAGTPIGIKCIVKHGFVYINDEKFSPTKPEENKILKNGDVISVKIKDNEIKLLIKNNY